MRALAAGAPVPSVTVDLNGPQMHLWSRPENRRPPFRVLPDGTIACVGLPAGRYKVRIDAEGYASSTREVEIAEGRETSVEVELRPGHRLVVVVEIPGAPDFEWLHAAIYDDHGNEVLAKPLGARVSWARVVAGGAQRGLVPRRRLDGLRPARGGDLRRRARGRADPGPAGDGAALVW